MRVMVLFQLHFFFFFFFFFFAKYLRVGEAGPGRGHLCHTDTFLVFNILNLQFSKFGWTEIIWLFSYCLLKIGRVIKESIKTYIFF